jgi:hypothetical protein
MSSPNTYHPLIITTSQNILLGLSDLGKTHRINQFCFSLKQLLQERQGVVNCQAAIYQLPIKQKPIAKVLFWHSAIHGQNGDIGKANRYNTNLQWGQNQLLHMPLEWSHI